MSVFVNLVELATLWSACYPVVLFEPLLLFPSMPTGQGPNIRVPIVVTDPNGSSFTISVKRREVYTWTVFQLKNAVREQFCYAKCPHNNGDDNDNGILFPDNDNDMAYKHRVRKKCFGTRE